MNQLVSAIITTHNRFALLPRAIESVLSQSYKNIECIVVDDASTDDTQNYCSNRSDIVYVRIEKKDSMGGNYARNKGISVAKGDLLAFLDDDDYWVKDKIEKQIQLLGSRKDLMVFCGRKIEIVNGDSVDYVADLPHHKSKGDMRHRILYTFPTVTSCIMVNKEMVEKIGCFDENLRYWQESEMLIRLAQIIQFEYVNEPLVVYRSDKNDTNRLSNKFYDWKKCVAYIRKKHNTLYNQLSFKESLLYRTHFYSDAANRARMCGMKFRYLMYFLMLIPLRIVRKIDSAL
mgnify:CR=1 FL=1